MDTSNPPSTRHGRRPHSRIHAEALPRSCCRDITVYKGDSDEYDSEEEQKILDELKPEEKADYQEYKEVFY